jgi:tRNA(fMet)-specific endonuclease VapC
MMDTDICSFIIKDRPDSVRLRFQKLPMERLCISIVTYAELMYGAERSSSKRINRAVIEHFVSHLAVIDWGIEAADKYAKVRTSLESKGSPIGAMDMMIAAHAKSLNAVLVTNNERHFNKVSGLPIENWA